MEGARLSQFLCCLLESQVIYANEILLANSATFMMLANFGSVLDSFTVLMAIRQVL